MCFIFDAYCRMEKDMSYFNPIPDKNIVLDDILKWIVDIVAVAMVTVFLIIYLCDTANMTGNSMAPTLNNAESVLINKFSYEIGDPERFDIIVFKNDDGETIKRIIGMPGEEIKIEDSKIYIRTSEGEQVLEDVYFEGKYEPGYVSDYVKIPEGEYFVMGDSRNVSEDSRFEYVGNIKKEDIVGEAWMIYSPFNRIGLID